jgi:hypothetical protein
MWGSHTVKTNTPSQLCWWSSLTSTCVLQISISVTPTTGMTRQIIRTQKKKKDSKNCLYYTSPTKSCYWLIAESMCVCVCLCVWVCVCLCVCMYVCVASGWAGRPWNILNVDMMKENIFYSSEITGCWQNVVILFIKFTIFQNVLISI